MIEAQQVVSPLAAMKQALEALEAYQLNGSVQLFDVAITSLRQAIAELESQEPVAHSVISGALFDFMGWLTSRKERIVLSSADNASPAVEAITEFARMRNLSLDDAKVQDWHTSPPQRTWVGLTDKEITVLFGPFPKYPSEWDDPDFYRLTQAIEAKLKKKNT